MKKLLFINACVRPESRTRRLAEEVLSVLKGQMNEEYRQEEVFLGDGRLTSLTWEQLQERDHHVKNGDFTAPMFSHARRFAKADVIVLAAPYWDLSFPASVKAYLEAVTVTGLTFYYTPEGQPAGLCRAKKLIYVTTAGGFIGEYDFGCQYVNTVARVFFGIPEVACVSAEGLDIVGADVEGILAKAVGEISL